MSEPDDGSRAALDRYCRMATGDPRRPAGGRAGVGDRARRPPARRGAARPVRRRGREPGGHAGRGAGRAGRPGRRRAGQRRPGRPGAAALEGQRRPVVADRAAPAGVGPPAAPTRRRDLLAGRRGTPVTPWSGPAPSPAGCAACRTSWPWPGRRSREMPRVHVETARLQLAGALSLLDSDVEELLGRAPTERALVEGPREAARAALEEHDRWLLDRLESSQRDPRLGERAFAAQLWYALDTEIDPDALLTRAESDLMAIEEEISAVAARIGPGLGVPRSSGPSEMVRDVLDALAAGGPVTNETVLPLCRRWLKVTQRRRPRARPGHDVRRPGPGDRDAGVAARRGGGVLRPARARSSAGSRAARATTYPPCSRSHRRRPTGTSGRSRPSTASTTSTCCSTSRSTRRCPVTSCSWTTRGGTAATPMSGPPCPAARSSRAGPCTASS